MEENYKLREIVRRLAGGNQREFSKKCGLQPATTCRLLNGTYAMSEKYIVKICSAYQTVNPDYLRGMSDVALLTDTPTHDPKDDEIARLKHENEILKWVIQQLGGQRINKK